MTTTTRTESTIPVGSWTIDPVHSSIGYSVSHLAGTFRGEFADYEVRLENAGGKPTLTGTVRAGSIRADDENLQAHLLSPEFFDAERHPEIGFVSNEAKLDDGRLVVAGELTIKGVTNAVEARGEIRGPVPHFHPEGGDRVGIDLEATVDRTEFGLNWNEELPNGGKVLGDEVTITVHLELRSEE